MAATVMTNQQQADALREQAKRLRQSAQYADGPAYREEMARARQLEDQARRLDGGADDGR